MFTATVIYKKQKKISHYLFLHNLGSKQNNMGAFWKSKLARMDFYLTFPAPGKSKNGLHLI